MWGGGGHRMPHSRRGRAAAARALAANSSNSNEPNLTTTIKHTVFNRYVGAKTFK